MRNFLYSLLQKFAKAFGYDLSITRPRIERPGYEAVHPRATYAPWLIDKQFRETFDLIKEYSLVDEYRCFELWQLVAESKKLNGALIEVGAWRGGTGALIAQSAERNNINDTVYICDTFTGVVKAGTNDLQYKGGEHADASKEMVEKLVFGTLGLRNAKVLQGIFPEETARLIHEQTFRFCHIDVDVYQSAKDIVAWIWPKLAIGGIIVYDDYGFRKCDGITKFVNEEREKSDRLIIHNLNGHAIVIKIR